MILRRFGRDEADERRAPGARLRLPRRRWLAGALGIVAVAAVACGGGGGDSSVSNAPVAPAPTSASAASSGQAGSSTHSAAAIAENLPLDFTVSAYQGADRLGGEKVKFSDIVAQGTPVVLNMWAGLCPPCRAEMPDLQAVHRQFGDRIILFGLDVGPFTGLGNKNDAVSLLKELGITYPAGNTDQGQVVAKYKVLGMPSTYFIKPDGSLMQAWNGLITESKLRELVQKLLAASA